MSIHHCTIFITKHHYGLCWYEYPWCAIKFLYVLKHYKRFNSPFSAKVHFAINTPVAIFSLGGAGRFGQILFEDCGVTQIIIAMMAMMALWTL